MPILLVYLLVFAACRSNVAEEAIAPPESRLEPSAPPASERRPLHEGFTQRPPKDTPGLPPPAEPLLSEMDRAELEAKSLRVSPEERDRAQSDLLVLVEEFEESGEGSVIRSKAREDVREGRVPYKTAEELFREFLFPNDEEAAEERYRGRAVVLTGAVAPHNMVDLADGFKLVETTPYVHEPVLLATEYELSFVRCHLARPEKLRDWQDVHLLGVVEGKSRGDVILRRCIVL